MPLLKRLKSFLPEITGITLLASLYLKTLAPTITFGDSGELVTAAATLGIPHPPGFPTWVVLTHLFTYIPLGSIAWRVNLSSTIYALLATLTLYYLLKVSLEHSIKGTKLSILSAILALLFGVSRTFWSHAVITEVHALLILLFLLMLLSLRKFIIKKESRFLYLGALAAGLAVGTHYMALVTLPAFFVWLGFLFWQKSLTMKHLAIASMVFILGLSTFVYLPLRAIHSPVINWGNPATVPSFIKVITRQQFSTTTAAVEAGFIINAPIAKPATKAEYILRIFTTPYQAIRIFTRELGIFLVALALVGITFWYKRFWHVKSEKQWLFLLTALLSSYGFIYIYLTTPTVLTSRKFGTDTFVEQLSIFPIILICAGYGILSLIQLDFVKKRPLSTYGIFIALVGILGFTIYNNFPANDKSRDTVAYDHGMNVLSTVPENGVLFIDKNDWLFPLLYLTKVEGKRPDIKLYDRTGNLFEDYYHLSSTKVNNRAELEQYRLKKEQELINKNPEKHYYYAADKNFDNEDTPTTQSGILYKYINQKPEEVDFPTKYGSILSLTKVPSQDYGTHYIIANYYFRYADYLISKGDTLGAKKQIETAYRLIPTNRLALTQLGVYFYRLEDLETAEEVFKKSLDIDSDSTVSLKNLATIYEQQNKPDQAAELYKRLLILEPANPDVLFKLIDLLASQNQCNEAESYLPENIPARYMPAISTLNRLGICYIQKGKLAKAEHYWTTAIKLQPDYQPAQENLIKLKKIQKEN